MILKFWIFEQIMKICGNLIIFLNSKNYMLEKTIWKTLECYSWDHCFEGSFQAAIFPESLRHSRKTYSDEMMQVQANVLYILVTKSNQQI